MNVAAVVSDLYARRIFRDSFFHIEEKTGPQAVLWALAFGPFFFWKKGVKVVAGIQILCALSAEVDTPFLSVDLRHSVIYQIAIWVLFAVLAPGLLTAIYRRRGWQELPEAADV